MKFNLIIDELGEDEVTVRLRAPSPIADRIRELVENESELTGFCEDGVTRLKPGEIYCVISENGRIYALTDEGRARLKSRLYVISAQLGDAFVMINQSCLVNVAKIKHFKVTFGGALCVELKNGYKDFVSRRQVRKVKERLGL